MLKLKLPRKCELIESKPFFLFVQDFWEKYGNNFPHIDLENFLFVKNETQKFEVHEHYVEIKITPDAMRLVLPTYKYLLIVYPTFNLLKELDIEKALHHCFSHVPEDYKKNLYLKEHEIQTFKSTSETFRKQTIKRAEDVYDGMQEI